MGGALGRLARLGGAAGQPQPPPQPMGDHQQLAAVGDQTAGVAAALIRGILGNGAGRRFVAAGGQRKQGKQDSGEPPAQPHDPRDARWASRSAILAAAAATSGPRSRC